MPKTTFHNLAEAKRDRLLQAAVVEFAGHDYTTANLDRIAAQAQVPKGSLYQYFHGKEDYYVHVVQHALTEAWQFFQRYIRQQSVEDCFDLLEHSILQMFALAKRHPELAAIYARVVYEPDTDLQAKLYPTYLAYSDQFHDRFLTWGLETGDIDPNLPPEVVRFQVHAIGTRWNQMILTGDWPTWIGGGERKRKQLVRESVQRLRLGLGPAK